MPTTSSSERRAAPHRICLWLGLALCLPLALSTRAHAVSQGDCLAKRSDFKLMASLCTQYIDAMAALGPAQSGPIMENIRRGMVAQAYSQRGFAYGSRNMFAEALADFNTAVNLMPTQPDYISNRGYANEQLGNKDQALSDYRQALSLKPTLGPALAGYKRLTGQAYAPR